VATRSERITILARGITIVNCVLIDCNIQEAEQLQTGWIYGMSHLSVDCDAVAPYSDRLTFWQYFCTI